MAKVNRVFPFIYIVLLLAVFFYVKSILSEEEIPVQIKEEKERVEEVKPIKVSLIVDGFITNQTYDLTLKNTNTFDDLLELLVKEKRLSYEKTEYTYGTEYDQINHEKAPEGFVWRIYDGEDEITFNTKGYKLTDGVVYRLVLEKR